MLKLDLESREAGCSTFQGPQGLYSVAFWSKCQVENQLCIFTPKERQEKTNKKSERWHKQMERYSMFLGRKNQYCENNATTKCIYRFNAMPTKLPMAFFTELEQKISQFMWKHKRPWIAKAVLRKKSGPGGSSFLTSGYTTKLQSSTQCGTGTYQKYRPMEQDRKPRNKPMHLWDLIFDKGGNNIQWAKARLFNKWCWENWEAMCKEWN